MGPVSITHGNSQPDVCHYSCFSFYPFSFFKHEEQSENTTTNERERRGGGGGGREREREVEQCRPRAARTGVTLEVLAASAVFCPLSPLHVSPLLRRDNRNGVTTAPTTQQHARRLKELQRTSHRHLGTVLSNQETTASGAN